ncbi:hypothetical protein C4561_01455 [candidate division WWE3 bacterium]|uniref:Uncharacterized protein n=1 Tax=candidate division WWE3 bacterium TaxID=2053526 RepID=A0A3A4ZF13_UNCKA|nr:MAG: hypothetical protein C4561_01455 [candidate division WWE3 bacterium]
MIDFVVQVLVCVFGVGAIWLVGRKSDKWKRLGFVFGCLSQPFWFYTFISHHQWVLVGIGVAYAYVWADGLRNHWKIKENQRI